MPKFAPPNPPYLGGPGIKIMHDGAGNPLRNKPIKRIVLHSTVGSTKAGSAAGVVSYFKSPAAGGSAHYVVDAGGPVQCVYDSLVAEHAPPNVGSLGVEMCDQPDARLPQGLERWKDADHRAMLRHTIQLVAELCCAYNVPPVFLTVPDLLAGRRGITTHNNVSHAFHESTHWDPGAWPQVDFMKRLAAKVDRIKAAAA